MTGAEPSVSLARGSSSLARPSGRIARPSVRLAGTSVRIARCSGNLARRSVSLARPSSGAPRRSVSLAGRSSSLARKSGKMAEQSGGGAGWLVRAGRGFVWLAQVHRVNVRRERYIVRQHQRLDDLRQFAAQCAHRPRPQHDLVAVKSFRAQQRRRRGS